MSFNEIRSPERYSTLTFSTLFRATPAIHQVLINPGVGPNPSFTIYTASNSLNIPNLQSVGLGLPASTNYNWRVLQIAPLNSVNDVASSTLNQLLSGNAGDLFFGQSEQFAFMTRP